MDTIKVGGDLVEFIKLCYAADLPALICGRHGIGKSEMLEQAAIGLGIGYKCRDLSLMEPTDLIGLPKAIGQNTIYLPPSFLPKNGKGLLVFEELNRCERYMRAPCLQLLTARALNDYDLPPGWLPVAAINPDDNDYEVDELDAALLSRFAQVLAAPDQVEWLKWARGQGVHSEVIRYVKSDDSIFDHPVSNPRAWKKVSDILYAAESAKTPTQTLRAAVLGLVGVERGISFLATLKNKAEQPLAADDILTSYRRCRPKVQRWIDDGRIELLQASLRSVQLYVQPKAGYQETLADRAAWKNLAQFLGDLPGDLQETAQAYFAERKYKYPVSKARKGCK